MLFKSREDELYENVLNKIISDNSVFKLRNNKKAHADYDILN